MHRRGFASPIIIGIVAIILIVGVAGYFLLFNNSLVSPPPTPPCCKTTTIQTSTISQSTTTTNITTSVTQPPVADDTSGWKKYTDSRHLFSIQIPAWWGIVTEGDSGDGKFDVEDTYFEFPDGTEIFSVSVNTTSSWAAVHSDLSNGPVPAFLGQNSQYVFGVSGSQVPITGESISAVEIAVTLPKIFATFNNFTPVTQPPAGGTTSSLSDTVNFPVPAMYPKDVWSFVSSTFAGGASVLEVDSPTGWSELSLPGQFYEATNTDPAAVAYEQYAASDTSGGPMGFYDGDQDFVTYYDNQVYDLGYEQSLGLDQNFNVISQGNPTYTLSPVSGDGPGGTMQGYIEASQGYIRVILIASNVNENEVFISNVVSLQSLMASDQ